jgi:hypothetical protein
MSANTSKSSNGSATTVWLVSYTLDGYAHVFVTTRNGEADDFAKRYSATVTQIDCAAVEELVAADRTYDEAWRATQDAHTFEQQTAADEVLVKAHKRRAAALARFGSAP